jgi:plasmid stability protein
MTQMPTLYIRNVPPEVYEALKARAKREGRSVNAEALKILEDVAERELRPTSVTDRLWEIADRIDWDRDAPPAQEVIRQMREECSEGSVRLGGDAD